MNDPAEDVLKYAQHIVSGARRSAYGNPEDNFARIAALYETYLVQAGMKKEDARKLEGHDVAILMILMKCARLIETPNHTDSWADIIGYGACGTRCAKCDTSSLLPKDTK